MVGFAGIAGAADHGGGEEVAAYAVVAILGPGVDQLVGHADVGADFDDETALFGGLADHRLGRRDLGGGQGAASLFEVA